MSITKYRAFIKVIELGSITKAAKDLRYSQPAISRMIDTLEDEIGFTLLNRNKDLFTPTENGKTILDYCYQIVALEDQMQAAANEIKGVSTGDIRIGAFNCLLSQFVPQVIAKFSFDYPNINVYLREIAYHSGLEWLKDGTIDISFMNSDVPRGFDFYPLFKDPLGVVMNCKSPLATEKCISIDQLKKCFIICPQPGWDAMFRQIISQKPFTPNVRHYVASDNAGIAMASNSLEVFIISHMQSKNIPKTVTFLPFKEGFFRTLGMCVRSYSGASPALKEFIKTAQAVALEDTQISRD